MPGATSCAGPAVLLVLAVAVATSALLTLVRVPSPALFGSLVRGPAHALTSGAPLAVPPVAFRVGRP